MNTDKAFFPDSPNLSDREGTITIEKNANVALGVLVEYRLNYSDTRIIGRYDVNAGNKVWYPFRRLATTETLNIRTYTTLEQIGLSDADMAEDDFVGNLAKINIALGAGYVHLFIMLSDSQPNLRESLFARMEKDGIDCRSINEEDGEFTLFLDRPFDTYRAIKIEVMKESRELVPLKKSVIKPFINVLKNIKSEKAF